MSILFKALARAAEANEARRAQELEPPPAPMSLPEPGEGPAADAPQLVSRKKVRPLRLVLIALVALLGGTLAALFFMGEDLMLLVEDLTGDAPPPRPAAPPKPPPPKPVMAPTPAPMPAPPPPAETKAEPTSEPPPPAETKTAEARKSPPVKPKRTPEEKAKAVEETRRAASADLPGLLELVRKRKEAEVLKPPVEIGSTGAVAPSALASSDGASLEMVSVRVPSGKARDELDAAYAALMRGQYETALRLYQSALAGDPRNAAAMLGKGSALHKLRRHAEARDLYDKVLELDPGNREALTNLLALFGAESPRDAIQQLIRLMRDNPSFSPIPAQIAQLYAQTEDLTAAIRYQGMAISLSPENLLYRLNLAVLQDRAGMPGEALASYEAVLASLGEDKGGLPVPEAQIRERVKYLRRR
jgi:tetratricopeptide (TPR) repeat protein